MNFPKVILLAIFYWPTSLATGRTQSCACWAIVPSPTVVDSVSESWPESLGVPRRENREPLRKYYHYQSVSTVKSREKLERIFWISVEISMLQQKNVSRVQTFRQRRDQAREERIAWQKRKNPSPEIRFSVHLSSYILFLLLLSMRLYYMPPTFCSNFVFGVRLYPLHNFNFFSQKSIRQPA